MSRKARLCSAPPVSEISDQTTPELAGMDWVGQGVGACYGAAGGIVSGEAVEGFGPGG